MTRAIPILTESEKVERLRQMGLDADRLPLNLTPQEREAALKPQEPQMPDVPVPAPVSPTGTPIVAPSGAFLKIAAIIVAIAGVVLVSDFFPQTTIDEKIAGAVVALGSVLGIASPGVRKRS